MSKFKKPALISLMILILAAAAFYFGYWIRTPQYALQTVASSIQNHDTAKFSRYVDLDNLYDKLFDDCLAAEVKPNKERTNAALLTHLAAIKRLVVPVFKAATVNYVKTGNAELTAGQADDPTGRGAQLAMGMAWKLGLANIEFKRLEGITRSGQEAVANLTVYDRQLDKDFPVHLRMRPNQDHYWQIVAVDDIPDYLKQRQEVLDVKLKELNGPKAAKIASIVRLLEDRDAPQMQLLVVRQPTLSYALKMVFTLVNTSPKDIASVSGIMRIYDKENTVRFVTSFEAGKIAAGKQLRTSNTWELNPYLADQQMLSRAKVSGLKASFEITSVIFADKSSISLQDRLPELH